MKKFFNNLGKKLYTYLSGHLDFNDGNEKKDISLYISQDTYSPALGLMISSLLKTIGCAEYRVIRNTLWHRVGFNVDNMADEQLDVILDTISSINLVLPDNHISIVCEVKHDAEN